MFQVHKERKHKYVETYDCSSTFAQRKVSNMDLGEYHHPSHQCWYMYDEIYYVVRATVEEYGMIYNYNKTYLGAVYSHYKMLKELGVQPIIVK